MNSEKKRICNQIKKLINKLEKIKEEKEIKSYKNNNELPPAGLTYTPLTKTELLWRRSLRTPFF